MQTELLGPMFESHSRFYPVEHHGNGSKYWLCFVWWISQYFLSTSIRSGCEAESRGLAPLMEVRRGAVSSPGQIIRGSEGQTSRRPLKSGRYSLTLLAQLHSRGRNVLIPAPRVGKETPQWERKRLSCPKLLCSVTPLPVCVRIYRKKADIGWKYEHHFYYFCGFFFSRLWGFWRQKTCLFMLYWGIFFVLIS